MKTVEVQKLPPGEALGARDLQKWSHNRTLGRWGVYDTKKERKRLGKFDKPKPDAADRWLASAGEPGVPGTSGSRKKQTRRRLEARHRRRQMKRQGQPQQKNAHAAPEPGQVVWGDSWDDVDQQSQSPPW